MLPDTLQSDGTGKAISLPRSLKMLAASLLGAEVFLELKQVYGIMFHRAKYYILA